MCTSLKKVKPPFSESEPGSWTPLEQLLFFFFFFFFDNVIALVQLIHNAKN